MTVTTLPTSRVRVTAITYFSTLDGWDSMEDSDANYYFRTPEAALAYVAANPIGECWQWDVYDRHEHRYLAGGPPRWE